MPLDTETVVLVEERDRLLEAREDVAEKVAGMDPDNPAHDGLIAEGKRLDNRLEGVEWAIAEWDVDTVTLAAPTGGEWGRMEDRLAEARDDADVTPGQGASRVYTVAQGTVEAPYVADAETFETRLAATAQLPVPYLKWAQAKISELMSVGNGERRSFDALVAAKRQEQSTER